MGLGAKGLVAMGLGAMGLGAMGLGAMGFGAMGLGAMSLGEMGLGAMGLGAKGLVAMGLGAMGLGAMGLRRRLDLGAMLGRRVKGIVGERSMSGLSSSDTVFLRARLREGDGLRSSELDRGLFFGGIGSELVCYEEG
jgi:hypothetical protein